MGIHLTLSGKGGAGKSMFTASLLAYMLKKNKEIMGVDADVDAPDLAVWLNANTYTIVKEIYAVNRVKILKPDVKAKSIELCPNGALEWKKGRIEYNKFLCEGCGLCNIIEPDIFEMVHVKNGEIREYTDVKLIEGSLEPGFTGSGKIVSEIMEFAKQKSNTLIVDGAAGTGCSVNAAIKESDMITLVIEESINGFIDFKRTLNIVKAFHKPFNVVINKHGLNKEIYKKISEEFEISGVIPYSKDIFECATKRINVYDCKRDLIKEVLKNIEEKIKTI